MHRPPPPRPPAPKTSPSLLRGRIGLRYLMFDAGMGGALLQPALDLRLDGQHLGGSPIGLAVDARAQRAMSTSSALSAAGANVTRVYQAALIYNAVGSPFRLSVRRQFAPALPTVGLLDGASMDFNYTRWGFGAFGCEPGDHLRRQLPRRRMGWGFAVSARPHPRDRRHSPERRRARRQLPVQHRLGESRPADAAPAGRARPRDDIHRHARGWAPAVGVARDESVGRDPHRGQRGDA